MKFWNELYYTYRNESDLIYTVGNRVTTIKNYQAFAFNIYIFSLVCSRVCNLTITVDKFVWVNYVKTMK